MPIIDRVRHIVADVMQCPIDDVTPESTPDSIQGWDSIAHLNLVLALEQEFPIQFLPEEIEQLLSVDLIAALLAEKITPCEVY